MKKTICKYQLFIIVLTLIVMKGKAQQGIEYYPKIGEALINYEFHDVVNYKSNSLKISDFNGRWLVLDFWSSNCAGCIENMPKLNKLKADFASNTDFVLVGLYSKDNKNRNSLTKGLYSRIQSRFKLNLIAAFDSLSFELYKPTAVPYILVVNPKGILVAKTYYLDSTLLENIMRGYRNVFTYSYSRGERNLSDNFDLSRPLLTNGTISNGGIDTAFVFRSVLSKWNPLSPNLVLGFRDNDTTALSKGNALATGVSLQELIRIALIGRNQWSIDNELYKKYYMPLLVECNNPGRILSYNVATGANMYSFNANTPGFSPKRIREMLIKDIEDVFAVKLSIESRVVPVWKLIVVNEKKVKNLRSHLGIPIYKRTDNSLKMQGVESSDLIRYLKLPIEVAEKKAYVKVLDATGISFPINIELSTDFFSFDDVLKSLHAHGLDLVKDFATMASIVVRDSQQ